MQFLTNEVAHKSIPIILCGILLILMFMFINISQGSVFYRLSKRKKMAVLEISIIFPTLKTLTSH